VKKSIVTEEREAGFKGIVAVRATIASNWIMSMKRIKKASLKK
jgi:hypothetical protein